MKFDPKKTIVYCDIDGVVANTILAYRMAIWDRYKVVVRESDVTEFNAQKALYEKVRDNSPFPSRDFEEFATYMMRVCFWNPQYYLDLLPRSPMWDAMQRLVNMEKKDGPVMAGPITWITTRHYSMWDITWQWLFRYGLVYRRAASSLGESGPELILKSDKEAVLKEVADEYPDCSIVFIDDKTTTIANVAQLRKPNIHCRIPIRAWNIPENSKQNDEDWEPIHDLAADGYTNVRHCWDDDIIEELGI